MICFIWRLPAQSSAFILVITLFLLGFDIAKGLKGEILTQMHEVRVPKTYSSSAFQSSIIAHCFSNFLKLFLFYPPKYIRGTFCAGLSLRTVSRPLRILSFTNSKANTIIQWWQPPYSVVGVRYSVFGIRCSNFCHQC